MTAFSKIVAQRAGAAKLGLQQGALEATAYCARRRQHQAEQADQKKHAKGRHDDAHGGLVAQNDIREIAP